MTRILAIAQSGLQAFSTKLSASASNLANMASEDFRPYEVQLVDTPGKGVSARVARAPQSDQVQLSREVVERMVATRAFEANLQVIRQEDERIGATLDLLA